MLKENKKIVFMPLGYWALVLLLIILLILFFYLNNSRVIKNKDILFENSLSKEWGQLNHEKKQVVMLGSSLLRFSYPINERDLSDEVELITFFKRGGKIYGFDQFIAKGMPITPDLFIIQTDMLADGHNAIYYFRRETQEYLNNIWLEFRGARKEDLSKKLRGRLIPREVKGCETLVPRTQRLVRNLNILYGGSSAPFRGVESRLRKLQAAGIKLALLSIPRSPVIEDQVQPALSDWNQYISSLAEDLEIPVIRYPLMLEDADFCDGAHMNQSTRESHAAWLKIQIMRMLNDAS